MDFPEDLKREIGRYLHGKYYQVVMEELLLMVVREDGIDPCITYDCYPLDRQRHCHYLSHLIYVQLYTIDSIPMEVDYVRWAMGRYNRMKSSSKIKNINDKKKKLQKMDTSL